MTALHKKMSKAQDKENRLKNRVHFSIIYLLQKFCSVEYKGLLGSSFSLEPKNLIKWASFKKKKKIILFYSI